MKNKKPLRRMAILLACSSIASTGQTQSFLWNDDYTGNTHHQDAFDVHYGADGNVYVCAQDQTTGNFDALILSYTTGGSLNWTNTYNGSASQDDNYAAVSSYGSGSSIHIYAAGYASMNTTGRDALLTKYDQSGTQLWASTWNNFYEYATSIAIDGSENVYIAGVTFVSGQNDFFILKYNSSGTLQWSQTWNNTGSSDDQPQYIQLNAGGTALYVTGYSALSASSHVAVLQKINTSTGAITWTATYGGATRNGYAETYWLDLDAQENIYTAGTTKNTSGNLDALILQYNSSGTLQCSVAYNGDNGYDDVLYSIDVIYPTDAPQIFVAGYTQIDPSSNDSDYLVMKYNSSCTQQWINTYNGSGTGCPTANSDIAYMLIATNGGNVYVTGNSFETGNSLDMTTVIYDGSTGSQTWIDSYDRGNTDNQVALKYPLEVAFDDCHQADQIFVTGYTREGIAGSPLDATTISYGATGACQRSMPVEPSAATITSTGIRVYPNPATEKIYVKTGAEHARAEIFDLIGKKHGAFNLSVGENVLDVHALPAGTYVVKVFDTPTHFKAFKVSITN